MGQGPVELHWQPHIENDLTLKVYVQIMKERTKILVSLNSSIQDTEDEEIIKEKLKGRRHRMLP